MESLTRSTGDMNNLSTIPHFVEKFTHFKCDKKKDTTFSNLKNHTKFTCHMKNLTSFEYNMEKHRQFMCDMKNLQRKTENYTQITGDMKNFTKFAYNKENRAQPTRDKKNQIKLAYNLENRTQVTYDQKSLTHFSTTWKCIHNSQAT